MRSLKEHNRWCAKHMRKGLAITVLCLINIIAINLEWWQGVVVALSETIVVGFLWSPSREFITCLLGIGLVVGLLYTLAAKRGIMTEDEDLYSRWLKEKGEDDNEQL